MWAASIEARRRTAQAQAQAQAIINHETDGVSTLPWVIIRETAIASNTCPVVYLCLNLLQEKRSRDNEDTTTGTGV
jgi:hypothetical protein